MSFTDIPQFSQHSTSIAPGKSIEISWKNVKLDGEIDSIFLKDMNQGEDDYVVITIMVKLPGGIDKYRNLIKLGDNYGFTGE